MRVITWNVNGFGSGGVEEELHALLDDADVVCLQEIKRKQEPKAIPGWTWFWNPSTGRPGYAGTAILARDALSPALVTMNKTRVLADEGRTLSVQLGDGTVILCAYVPNSGVAKKEPLKRLALRINEWDPELRALFEGHRAKRAVLCGDLNVAIREIDVHNPKTLRRKAGFTREERLSFEEHFGDLGDAWVDVHGADAKGFTFWGSYVGLKAADKGWRLDYQLHQGMEPVHAQIYREVSASDHVPLRIDYA